MSSTSRILIALLIAVALVFLWYEYAGRPQIAPANPVVSLSATVPTTSQAQTTVQSTTTPATHAPQVTLDGQVINVTLALTEAQQAQGLGGRTGLSSHEGMLFVFPDDAQHMFWMKDMEFSIDMVWFDSSGTVIYIQPNVAPDTYPEAFGPAQGSRYVLELPADFAATYGIKVGDKATLP